MSVKDTEISVSTCQLALLCPLRYIWNWLNAFPASPFYGLCFWKFLGDLGSRGHLRLQLLWTASVLDCVSHSCCPFSTQVNPLMEFRTCSCLVVCMVGEGSTNAMSLAAFKESLGELEGFTSKQCSHHKINIRFSHHFHPLVGLQTPAWHLAFFSPHSLLPLFWLSYA